MPPFHQDNGLGKAMKGSFVICITLVFLSATISVMAENVVTQGLTYEIADKNIVPIPPFEKQLRSVVATHLKEVTPSANVLEGAIFDDNGNLYFTEIGPNRVLQLDKKGNLNTLAKFEDFMPTGLAFLPNGRLLVSGNADGASKGAIYSLNPDGSDIEEILKADSGYIPNDMAVNSKGGIYFTDFKGTMTDTSGGIYYIHPGFEKIEKIVGNMANANGIALSPDEKVLWTGDYGRSILYRIDLFDDTHFDRIHSTPVYYFTGRGPDSMRTDSDGNLYVAIMSQGRVLVFNPRGLPIGQVLLPNREQGHNLYSASLAIKPTSREMVILAMDDLDKSSNLFLSGAFAQGKCK